MDPINSRDGCATGRSRRASATRGRSPCADHQLDVPPRGPAKHARVLAAKLGRTRVTHFECCALRAGRVRDHQPSRLQKTKLLLILQGSHRSQLLELTME